VRRRNRKRPVPLCAEEGCCEDAVPGTRRCAGHGYERTKEQGRERAVSPLAKASLVQTAKQVKAMERDPWYREGRGR